MSWTVQIFGTLLILLLTSILTNALRQLLFVDRSKPPVVWHWLPVFGSAAAYGQEPYQFWFKCREKYGNVFTFKMLGMNVTAYLGTEGNNFILNGKHANLNAEEVYGPLTIPVFGKGVVYDVGTQRFMDQKRLIKGGFTTESLKAYIPKFVLEVEQYIATNPTFAAQSGICDISTVFSEIALYCAASSLQGKEVRDAFDSTFATLYRHLDDGFAPVNFVLPGLPLPVNRRRDHAQRTMAKLYKGIIQRRRDGKSGNDETDMLSALTDATYKDGTTITDDELANMMIALLMGGQHNTAASGTWIMLHLANRPELIEELHREQELLADKKMPRYEELAKLTLHNAVIKETLRLNSPVHSVMRKVKTAMTIPGTDMIVPEGHILLAAPGFPARTQEHFSKPMEWDPKRWIVPQEKEESDGNDGIDYGYGMVSSKAASSPYLPFGAGRHRCVGEHFAYAQLTAILATLVRLIDWQQVDPSAPVPKTDYSSMFSRPMHPATIKWKQR